MHQLLTHAALLLQAATPTPETFWPRTLVELTQSISGVAVVAGGLWALRGYFQTQRLKAAEILMQMEAEFRVILPTYELIDISSAYLRKLAPVLDKLHAGGQLDDAEVQVTTDLDRCLRFFVLCAVLNKDLGVEGNALLRSYYYHTALLAEISDPNAVEDADRRRSAGEMGLLKWYLAAFYPRLCKWVKANRQNLLRLRAGKRWRKELEPTSIDYDDD